MPSRYRNIAIVNSGTGGGDGLYVGPLDGMHGLAAKSIVGMDAEVSDTFVYNSGGNGVRVVESENQVRLDNITVVGNAGHGLVVNRHERRKRAAEQKRS